MTLKQFLELLPGLLRIGGEYAIIIFIIVSLIRKNKKKKDVNSDKKEVKPTLTYKICSVFILPLLFLGNISVELFGLGYLVYTAFVFMFFVQDVKNGQDFFPLLLEYIVMRIKAIFFAPFLILVLLAKIANLIPDFFSRDALIRTAAFMDFMDYFSS